MLLLESGNRIVADTVRSVVLPDPDSKPQRFEVKVNDFDNAAFCISTNDEADTITVSLALPCYSQIAAMGARAAAEKVFGAQLAPEAEAGYDVTVVVTKAQWTGNEEATIEALAGLKKTVLGGVFEHFLEAVHKGTSGSMQPFKFALRPDTVIFFLPSADRVVVTFHLSLIDRADMEIGRVFLVEFADPALRRKAQRAPIVNFDVQAPAHLKVFGVDSAAKGDLGFVSFTLLGMHCADGVRARACEQLQTFRNFVQYHLKCAKAYFHSRMRLRVSELTKVLNRAKTKAAEKAQPKFVTTAAGKLSLAK